MSHPTGEHPYQPPLMYDPVTATYSSDVIEESKHLPSAMPAEYDPYGTSQYRQVNGARVDDAGRLPDLTPPRNPQQPGQHTSTPNTSHQPAPPVGPREVANRRRQQPGQQPNQTPVTRPTVNTHAPGPLPPRVNNGHLPSAINPGTQRPQYQAVQEQAHNLERLSTRALIGFRLALAIGRKLVPAVIARTGTALHVIADDYGKIRAAAYEREQAELRFAGIMANSASGLPRARSEQEQKRLLQASRLANEIVSRLSNQGYADLFRNGHRQGLIPSKAFTSLLFSERISFDGRSPEEQKADMEVMGYAYDLATRMFKANAYQQPTAQVMQPIGQQYRMPQAAPAHPQQNRYNNI